jgi:hypothetical protein
MRLAVWINAIADRQASLTARMLVQNDLWWVGSRKGWMLLGEEQGLVSPEVTHLGPWGISKKRQCLIQKVLADVTILLNN